MRIWLYILLITLLSCNAAYADTSTMEILGKGSVRYFGLLKVYEATLYSPQKTNSRQILQHNISKCLQLEYNVSLSAEDIIKGANIILARQYTPSILAGVESDLDVLNNALEDVTDGDRYLLCYDADSSTTTLSFNDKNKISIISAEFASLYFGIWLGPIEPIDESLRDNLLSYDTSKSE